MNLRSGTITLKQRCKPKTKTKATRGTNSSEQNMATASLETSLKAMFTTFQEEITGQIQLVRTDIETFSLEMTHLRKDVNEMRNELTEAGQRIDQLENREETMQKIIKDMQQEQKRMSEKLDYLENKSRQNNIRIYQVKEGLEGNDPTAFIKKLIRDKLGIPTEEIIVSAAHRSLTQRQVLGEGPPRSFVVRFQEWHMRQKVLRMAWSQKEITAGGNRIFFSQDFSTKIQGERSKYAPIRKQLRAKEVKSHIIYPAKLKVFLDGRVTTYNTPEEALINLQELGILSAVEPTERSPEPSGAVATAGIFQTAH